jgi:hypothetical protein
MAVCLWLGQGSGLRSYWITIAPPEPDYLGNLCYIIWLQFTIQPTGGHVLVSNSWCAPNDSEGHPNVSQSASVIAICCVWGSNPGGSEIFSTLPDRTRISSCLLTIQIGRLLGGKTAVSVAFTTRPLLALWLCMARAIPLLPYHVCVIFYIVTFTFTFTLFYVISPWRFIVVTV